MTGAIIEGGVCFLLLFTPFAFGGVESWAQGVLQVVSGLLVAVWLWGRRGATRRQAQRGAPAAGLTVLWISIALFVLLVLFQLVPLPPSWIRSLSPGTHDLYARTLPGYAEGLDFDAARLPDWLLARKSGQLPGAMRGGGVEMPVLPPLEASGLPTRASSWRTLTIYPFETWQRLSLLLSLVGVFAVVVDWYRTKERLARLLGVAVFSGFTLSLLGIIQKMTWNGKLYWVREGTYANAFGPFVNQNTYAAFAGTLFPLAVCMTLNAWRHIEQGRPGAAPRLLLWGFATVTLCGGIFYSLSRGGILAAAVSLVIVAGMLIYYGRGRKELAMLGVMCLGAAGFLYWIGPELVIERVGTLSQGQSIPSLTARMGAWRLSMDLIGSSPWVGSGLGSFRFAFMRFAPPGEGWWVEADNEYIELICDTGIVGGALFLAGLAGWVGLVARPWLFRDRTERYQYIGVMAGIAGLLLHSAISSNLQIPANGVALAVSGGALVCLARNQEGGRRRPDGASSGPERRAGAVQRETSS